jgi:hypothetical protein
MPLSSRAQRSDPPPAIGTDANAGFLRQMSGMKIDERDLRLLRPVTERIMGCAFRLANALGPGSSKGFPQ